MALNKDISEVYPHLDDGAISSQYSGMTMEKVLEMIRSSGNDIIAKRRMWREKLLSIMKEGKRDIYIWGTGAVAQGFYHEFKPLGLRVNCFVDNNLQQEGKYLADIPIISPKSLSASTNSLIIIGTAMYSRDVFAQAIKMGISNIIDAMDFRLNFMFEDLERGVSWKEIAQKISTIYHYLGDDESREVYLRHLIHFFFFQSGYHPPIYYHDLCRPQQYFPSDIIDFNHKDVLVDCGAYTGDTLAEFISLQKPFAKYICYELSKRNYSKLINNVECTRCMQRGDTYDKKIECYNLGVGSRNENIFFDDNESETRCLVGGTQGQIVRIADHLAEEKVSFIKMDLEGMEMAALQGADTLIRKQKPKLAICIYHKISDFWKIPEYMLEMNHDYHLYIRQHTPHWPETVCYAIR